MGNSAAPARIFSHPAVAALSRVKYLPADGVSCFRQRVHKTRIGYLPPWTIRHDDIRLHLVSVEDVPL
jgi:hypothetical protein